MGGTLSTPVQAAPTGAEVLLAMTRARGTVSFRGTLVAQRPGAPTVKARIWKQGVKHRLEFLEPQIMNGDLMLDDGTHIWRYHKSENAAVQTRSSPSSALDLGWKQLQSRYTAKVVGEANIAGRKSWVVTLSSRGQNQIIRKFWIDQANKAQLRAEHYSDGKQTETLTLQSVVFTSIPTSQFKWSTPVGAKLTKSGGTMFVQAGPARQAAAWLKWPASVPGGYAFESAIVDNARREAWLRYTNGLNRFSIFQQRADNSNSVQLRPVDGAWFWQSGGYRFLIVGLSESQARQVANSIR
jgi:negative regulator of sigma E activity